MHLSRRTRRAGLPLLLLVLALMLAACSEDTETREADTAETTPADATPAATPADAEKPELRIYITRLREYGEVAGITAASDEFVDLTLRMESADGEPLTAAEIEISSLIGNELSDTIVATDDDGDASLRIKPVLPGDDVLTFTADGVSRQVTLYITDEAYGHSMEHMEERETELPEVDGVVPWSLLSGIDTEEGQHGMLRPVFNDKVRDLDGREVKVQGFMLPLENEDRHSHFIITRSPPSCFFCLPGGPESVVEVKTDQKLEFSFDPVVIKGRLALMEDSDMGLFYRLDNASLE